MHGISKYEENNWQYQKRTNFSHNLQSTNRPVRENDTKRNETKQNRTRCIYAMELQNWANRQSMQSQFTLNKCSFFHSPSLALAPFANPSQFWNPHPKLKYPLCSITCIEFLMSTPIRLFQIVHSVHVRLYVCMCVRMQCMVWPKRLLNKSIKQLQSVHIYLVYLSHTIMQRNIELWRESIKQNDSFNFGFEFSDLFSFSLSLCMWECAIIFDLSHLNETDSFRFDRVTGNLQANRYQFQ